MKNLSLIILLVLSFFSCKEAPQLEEENAVTLPGDIYNKNGNPVIKTLLPSGTLPNSTGTVNLQVETDERAVCKFTENNVSFYGMTETLNSSDGLSHSREINISEVKTYTYYVSCQDLDGALSLGNNKIEFTIDSNTTDLVAPNIFNAGPTSTLGDGTTQVNIYATTNEDATCRYSNNPEDEWADMSQMSATGTNSHAQNVSGLSDGNTYNYYFICEDPSGNKSTKKGIAFSVSTFILQDGETLYANNCAYCHGQLPFSEHMGASANDIQRAINSIGSMQAFDYMRPEEIQNLADAMAN